jgi:hypothetical protein
VLVLGGIHVAAELVRSRPEGRPEAERRPELFFFCLALFMLGVCMGEAGPFLPGDHSRPAGGPLA